LFSENFDRRILVGMMLIVVAGMLLSWEQIPQLGVPWGALAIIGACLCWALDNNLTRKVSASDAVQIAVIKGLVAGTVNFSLALLLGAHWPVWDKVLASALVGFFGYGLSLVMFVMALRHLGTARTGAYFSAAPFVGALTSPLCWLGFPARCSGLLLC
jgi:drug/metabolite transporter (DMT)-like permease